MRRTYPWGVASLSCLLCMSISSIGVTVLCGGPCNRRVLVQSIVVLVDILLRYPALHSLWKIVCFRVCICAMCTRNVTYKMPLLLAFTKSDLRMAFTWLLLLMVVATEGKVSMRAEIAWVRLSVQGSSNIDQILCSTDGYNVFKKYT